MCVGVCGRVCVHVCGRHMSGIGEGFVAVIAKGTDPVPKNGNTECREHAQVFQGLGLCSKIRGGKAGRPGKREDDAYREHA
jgi:hypothetical protein